MLVFPALVLAGCASGHPSSGASNRPVAPAAQTPTTNPTEQQVFAPFDAAGTPLVDAAAAGSAECFATSIAVPLAGVYRCLAGNRILDPCFVPAEPAQPTAVTCFADPWTPGQRMTLQGVLPTFTPVPSAGNPWAVQLADGKRCIIRTGTVPEVDGVDLLYSCDGGAAAGLSSDGADLVAHYGPPAGPLRTEPVSVAWRAISYRYGD